MAISNQETVRPATGKVQVGDQAPDFTLLDNYGKQWRLAEHLGAKALALYFYPADETIGCTDEACAFRDNYEAFQDAGAEVIGVSGDAVESHQKFAEHHSLPFVLLSDKGGALQKLYGVPKTLGLLPGRVTYVIDRQGVVRHIFNNQFAPTKHINEALQVIRGL